MTLVAVLEHPCKSKRNYYVKWCSPSKTKRKSDLMGDSKVCSFFFNLFKRPTDTAKCDHFIMVSFTKQGSEEDLIFDAPFPKLKSPALTLFKVSLNRARGMLFLQLYLFRCTDPNCMWLPSPYTKCQKTEKGEMSREENSI